MGVIEHSFPRCTVCGMPHNGYEGPCLEPGCPGRVTWEATADRLYEQLRGAVRDRDRWQDCARKLYAKWQAGERPPSESALGRIGFQMREPGRGQ